MARETIHLHGHVHLDQNSKYGPGKMLDVGCDGNDLKPYDIKDIIREMNSRPINSLFQNDYHKKP